MTIAAIRLIESQAAEAAKWHVDNPKLPKPRNPYFEDVQPFHYATWRGKFELGLLQYSAARMEAQSA